MSVTRVFGKFNNSSKTPVLTKLPIYRGMGKTTLNLLGLASPSLARIFDKKSVGVKDIRMYP